MESATMTKASRAGATSIHCGLLEEIAIWEILIRLTPKSLRCRAVCRAWRRATSTLAFLQTHHERQPNLPIVSGSGTRVENILAFDHRPVADAWLQLVIGLNKFFWPETSCDGLLILSRHDMSGISYSVCNPTTRQHAPLPQLSDFKLLGMYVHRPTNEYRLLLHRILTDQICFVLGSDQLPRYIAGIEVAASSYLHKPALLRDCLHWYPVQRRHRI